MKEKDYTEILHYVITKVKNHNLQDLIQVHQLKSIHKRQRQGALVMACQREESFFGLYKDNLRSQTGVKGENLVCLL